MPGKKWVPFYHPFMQLLSWPSCTSALLDHQTFDLDVNTTFFSANKLAHCWLLCLQIKPARLATGGMPPNPSLHCPAQLWLVLQVWLFKNRSPPSQHQLRAKAFQACSAPVYEDIINKNYLSVNGKSKLQQEKLQLLCITTVCHYRLITLVDPRDEALLQQTLKKHLVNIKL